MNHGNGDQRGVFIENGMVALATRYHKSQWQTQTGQLIHRYLPDEVGKILIYYLWLVLPLDHALRVAALGQTMPRSPFIWLPRPDDTGDRIKVKAQATHGLRPELPVSNISNLGNSFSRRQPKYWCLPMFTEAMKGVFGHYTPHHLNPSTYQHLAIALYRKFCHHPQRPDLEHVVDLLGPQEPGTAPSRARGWALEEQPFDLQAGHRSGTAEMRYGRDTGQHVGTTRSAQSAFREVSTLWHQFLRFPSALVQLQRASAVTGAPVPRPGQPLGAEDAAEADKFVRREMIQAADLDHALAQVHGPNATFRGRQQEALECIQTGQSDMLVVAGTGSGKSLLFILPALIAPVGLTIVVVPLVALRNDIKQRCERLRISAVEWDESDKLTSSDATIVLVTPESACTPGFRDFVNLQRSLGRLDRVVFDECHTLLQATRDWRPKFFKIPFLRAAKVPFICMTATLPPQHEGRFIELIWPTSSTLLVTLREPTTRPNISYQVRDLKPRPGQSGFDAAVACIRDRTELYRGKGSVLVYTSLISDGLRLAAELDCPFYDGAFGRTADGPWVVQQLVEGNLSIVVATSALGLGIDAPFIRAVFHYGRPHKLQDYAQASGRAGRDGQPSKAIMLRLPGDVPSSHPATRQYTSHQVCRRTVLDQFMDGVQRVGGCSAARGELACDLCMAKTLPTSSEAAAPVAPDPVAGAEVSPAHPGLPQPGKAAVSPLGISSTASASTRDQDVFLSTRSSPPPSSPSGHHSGTAYHLAPPPPVRPATKRKAADVLIASGVHIPSPAGSTPARANNQRHGSSGNSRSSEHTAASTSTATGSPAPWSLQYTRDQLIKEHLAGNKLKSQFALLHQWLVKWQDHCILCALHGASHDHPINHCDDQLLQTVVQAKRLHAASRYSCEDGSQCYNCAVPWNLCCGSSYPYNPCTSPYGRIHVWQTFLAFYYASVDDRFSPVLGLAFDGLQLPQPGMDGTDDSRDYLAPATRLAAVHLVIKKQRNYKCSVMWVHLFHAWDAVSHLWADSPDKRLRQA